MNNLIQGFFSRVYLVEDSQPGCYVAIKTADTTKAEKVDTEDIIANEIEILTKAQHSDITHFKKSKILW